jgi:hypothetical protein
MASGQSLPEPKDAEPDPHSPRIISRSLTEYHPSWTRYLSVADRSLTTPFLSRQELFTPSGLTGPKFDIVRDAGSDASGSPHPPPVPSAEENSTATTPSRPSISLGPLPKVNWDALPGFLDNSKCKRSVTFDLTRNEKFADAKLHWDGVSEGANNNNSNRNNDNDNRNTSDENEQDADEELCEELDLDDWNGGDAEPPASIFCAYGYEFFVKGLMGFVSEAFGKTANWVREG